MGASPCYLLSIVLALYDPYWWLLSVHLALSFKKSDFFGYFIKVQKLVENKFAKKIKIFYCDGGGEFNSHNFLNHVQSNGIQQQISYPHTPKQNEVAERKYLHIVETEHTILLFHANMSMYLWVDACLTETYLINRLP